MLVKPPRNPESHRSKWKHTTGRNHDLNYSSKALCLTEMVIMRQNYNTVSLSGEHRDLDTSRELKWNTLALHPVIYILADRHGDRKYCTGDNMIVNGKCKDWVKAWRKLRQQICKYWVRWSSIREMNTAFPNIAGVTRLPYLFIIANDHLRWENCKTCKVGLVGTWTGLWRIRCGKNCTRACMHTSHWYASEINNCFCSAKCEGGSGWLSKKD